MAAHSAKHKEAISNHLGCTAPANNEQVAYSSHSIHIHNFPLNTITLRKDSSLRHFLDKCVNFQRLMVADPASPAYRL
jgi:hypothetical protein